MQDIFLGAWRYRTFIMASVIADFRNRVSRSRLGILWVVISPLAQVTIFALILSAIMQQRLPGIDNRFAYAIYLMAGFLAWSLFVEVFSRSVTVFIDNANALKKIVFPKISLPIILFAVGLINNTVFFMAVAAVYLVLGHGFGASIVWLPLLMLLTGGLALSAGLVFGILNVFIRDIGQSVPILLQLGFWFTPIVYMPSILPEAYRGLLKVNPLYWIVSTYHDVLVFQRAPDPTTLTGLALLVIALAALALFLFRKASPEMVDVL